MADVQGLASALFGRGRLERAASEPTGTSTAFGTVMSDSEGGMVRVVVEGDHTSPGDAGDEMPTTVHARAGQTALVSVVDGRPTVTGVYGGGDEMSDAIGGVRDDLDAYKAQASDLFARSNELVESEERVRRTMRAHYASGKSVRDLRTTVEQTAEEVRASAREEARDLVAGEAEARDAAIRIAANGITQEVSRTYATNDAVGALETRVTQTERDVTTVIDTAVDAAVEAASDLGPPVLVLESSNGLLFKNGSEDTVLRAVVFAHGGERIDTAEALRRRFGATAYVEWSWRHEDGAWGTLLSGDPHLSMGDMWLTVTPADVDEKTTFSASLVVPGEGE